MNYCTASDVLVYAPQAEPLVTANAAALAPWIAEAGGLIDAYLRGQYVVPLFGGVEASVDQFVSTIAAKLAAGLALRSKLSAKSREPSPYAERLIEEAMDAIGLLKSDLTMIDSALRADSGSAIPESQLEVTLADNARGPYFTMDRERY